MGQGALSYVVESDTGHMTQMHARLARFHEVQRQRGMSEAAIARLPSLPKRAARLDAGLPPVVLATRKNANTDAYQRAAAQLAWRRKIKREG